MGLPTGHGRTQKWPPSVAGSGQQLPSGGTTLRAPLSVLKLGLAGSSAVGQLLWAVRSRDVVIECLYSFIYALCLDCVHPTFQLPLAPHTQQPSCHTFSTC